MHVCVVVHLPVSHWYYYGDGHFYCVKLQSQHNHDLCRGAGLVVCLSDGEPMVSGLHSVEVKFLLGEGRTP